MTEDWKNDMMTFEEFWGYFPKKIAYMWAQCRNIARGMVKYV